MKKIVIILIMGLALFACHTPRKVASGNKAYIPFEKFNGDTLQYSKVNFEENKTFYVGRTVQALIDDLELPFEVTSHFETVKKQTPDGKVEFKKECNMLSLMISSSTFIEVSRNDRRIAYIYRERECSYRKL